MGRFPFGAAVAALSLMSIDVHRSPRPSPAAGGRARREARAPGRPSEHRREAAARTGAIVRSRAAGTHFYFIWHFTVLPFDTMTQFAGPKPVSPH